MKLTQKLAYSQIKKNRSRSFWTLSGIVLSTAMITAVFGFAASGNAMIREVMGGNEYYTNMYNATIYGMSAVFVSIIVAASVIVVSNAFRVSAGERISQFGILKSVGATKKQIAGTIVYEGVYLCAIGIPAGIVLGLFVNLAGIQIINYYLEELFALNPGLIALEFSLVWQVLALAVVVSFVTVILSAWLPARKAARIPAIDAIRGAGEVQIKAKHVRANWLVKSLFGFEGALASKSLRRSRRNFRATVVSLTVSVTLLITALAFGMQMQTIMDMFYPDIDATVEAVFHSSTRTEYGNDGEISAWEYVTIDSDLANQITETLRGYPGTAVFGIGADPNSFTSTIPIEMMTSKMTEELDPYGYWPDIREHSLAAVFLVTDSENYAALCRRAGVPLGSNILINHTVFYRSGGRLVFEPYVFDNQTLRITGYYDGTEFDLPLHGVLTGQDLPGEVLESSNGALTILVPSFDVGRYSWFASTADNAGFTEYARSVLHDSLPTEHELAGLIVADIEAQRAIMRGMARLIMTFIYGFVSMLTLIGLTNVISTISANVSKRAREFAVLRSVGMTDSGLGRMLNLESILCSVKSLVFGVPLGIAGSVLSFMALDMPIEFKYELPWLPIVFCSLGVFVLSWGITRFTAARLRGGSIVETIRSESIM